MGDEPLFQHPLAYLLGLEGLALAQAFSGEYGEEFTLARLAEIRGLLERADELGEGTVIRALSVGDAYAEWAPHYDASVNQMVATEGPAMWAILDRLPVGDALDAACGTGRDSARLAELGHRVIGVDASPAMLDVARGKLPGVEFREGDLHALALGDGSVDLVVCGLALMHVPSLAEALGEFARVLRPGGHLVLSDWRALTWNRREPFVRITDGGVYGYADGWCRPTSEYLSTALALGYELRGIEELTGPRPLVDADGRSAGDPGPPPAHRPGEPPNRWALHRFAPEATNAAYRDKPLVLILHLQLGSGGSGRSPGAGHE